MPESNGIGTVAAGIGAGATILGFISGAAMALVGKGRRDQAIDLKLAEHDKKLTSVEDAIRNLAASFVVDGNPRFITAPACGQSQAACRAVLIEKFSAGAARFGVIESDIKEIKESQADNLKTIIDEIRRNK